MNRQPSKPIKTTIFLLISLALAACGVRGAPAVPPPMWGNPAPDAASSTPEKVAPEAKQSDTEND
ncbi:MAG: hypothetical protein COA47_00645 [Robiginitomaculum sp.]|nr:MAG: hypothetical protein COA47_00645 [Robiginitomaculum sp.]